MDGESSLLDRAWGGWEALKAIKDEALDARVRQRDDPLASYLALELGERVTDFTVPDLDGNPVRLYDLLAENELVLIDFWAAWCAPCLAQFPLLKELRAQYRDRGFEILGFSVDARRSRSGDCGAAVIPLLPPGKRFASLMAH